MTTKYSRNIKRKYFSIFIFILDNLFYTLDNFLDIF